MQDSYNYIKNSDLESYATKYKFSYVISFANHILRVKLATILNSYGNNSVNIIHPTAFISPSADIGSGNYIATGSIISSNAKISNHCMINFNSSIGHDSVINDHCIINPGARVSGNVSTEDRVSIGTDSIVFQEKSIGDDCIIVH